METLNARCKFYLTGKALKRLDEEADRSGLSRSEYVRRLIGEKPIIPFPKHDLSGFIREANEIGQIINGCAIRSRTQGFVSPDEIIACSERLHALTDRFFPLFVERSDEIWKERAICRLTSLGSDKREVEVRMTKQEKETFDRDVKASGLTRSAYLTVLLTGRRVDACPSKDFFGFWHEMSRIKMNMSMIVLSLKDHRTRSYKTCSSLLEWLGRFDSKMNYLLTERVQPERKYW